MKPKNQNGQRDARGKDEERLVTVSFAAKPSEIASWKAKAKADHRPLSAWLYLRLLAADARDEESVARTVERTEIHGAV